MYHFPLNVYCSHELLQIEINGSYKRKNNHNLHQECFYTCAVDLSRREGDDYDPIRRRLLWLFIVASELVRTYYMDM